MCKNTILRNRFSAESVKLTVFSRNALKRHTCATLQARVDESTYIPNSETERQLLPSFRKASLMAVTGLVERNA
jgi:hypothetical protein